MEGPAGKPGSDGKPGPSGLGKIYCGLSPIAVAATNDTDYRGRDGSAWGPRTSRETRSRWTSRERSE